MTTPVYRAGPEILAGAATRGHVTLAGPEARHAVTVRRTRTGEAVDLIDGRGTRVRGTVTATGRDELTLRVEEVVHEPEPAVRLVLVQALAKGGRDEMAVEAATELGVDAVVPWRSARSVSVWTGAKIDRGRQRWSGVALAAAKQSRRARVPDVAPLRTTAELAAETATTVAAGGAVLVLHETAAVPIGGARLPEPGTVRTTATTARPVEVAVVVGPEGGLTEEEVAALAGAGAQPVLLGPHVLRTSTAGPAALAVLAQRTGRWA